MEPDERYDAREQARVKHEVLRGYLRRLAHIILISRGTGITYVDCFSGPWNVKSDDLRDSSFAIALSELDSARTAYYQRKVQQVGVKEVAAVRIRCLFLEKYKAPFAELQKFARAKSGRNTCVRALNKDFDAARDDILEFVRESDEFPFLFIDPKGWRGVSIESIRPLLEMRRGEVLVTFMTSFVRRFVTDRRPGTRRSMEALFGPNVNLDRIADLHGVERDDAAVEEYARALKQIGGF